MTTLLKPGVEKIMRVFYHLKKGDIHLRELSRKTGLHGQSITRHLKYLEKEKILKSRMEGNQKRYSVIPSKEVFAVFALFDIERFDSLPSIKKRAINAYLAALSRRPYFAILFGSTAEGTFTDRSDIDILLVGNEKIDSRDAEREADALYVQDISSFKMLYNAFKEELRLREDPVVQSAMESGYPLMNHVMYYEELFDERIRSESAIGGFGRDRPKDR